MAEETGSSNPLDALNNSVNALLSGIGKAVASNGLATEIAKAVVELDNSAVGIAKSFGLGRESVQGIKEAMADAYISVVKLGGGLSDIAEIQEKVGVTLGRSFVLSSDSYEKLYATTKVTGQSIEKITTSFKDAGASVYQAGKGMEDVVNTARSLGVNVEAVSSKVLTNMSALNKFGFEGGVIGLSKMAAQATSLRIDMDKSLKLAEDLFNPEKAIELAASMQRLGVANSQLLDPLRLMDLAQNDPAELQNQIVEMTKGFSKFNEETGKFEIPQGARRQLMEISKELGFSYEELTKMAFGAQELDMKMSKIKFPEGAFSDEQKQMIANMAEMGEDGQFKITIDGKAMDLGEAIAKAEADKNGDFLKKLEEASRPKTMEEIAEGQLKILEKINANIGSLTRVPMAVARGKTATQALEMPADLTKLLRDTFDTQALSVRNLGKGFDDGAQDILNTLTKFASGEGSLTDVFSKLQENGEKLNNFASGAFAQSAEKYLESLDKLGQSNNAVYKLLEQTFKGVIENGKDFMMGKDYNYNNPKPVVSPTLPTNIEKAKEITSQQNNITPPSQPTSTESTVTANVNLNITAPPNIDTNQLVVAFQDTGVKQAIVDVVATAPYNNGLTSNTPNKAQANLAIRQNSGILG